MNKFLNILNEKLGLSEEDIKTKLNINQEEELTDKLLRDKLGIYSIFTEKEDHQNYIFKKLDNKQKELDFLKDIENKFNNVNSDFSLLNSKIEELVKKEWKNISTDKLPEIDLKEIDLSNLKQSLLKVADNNNLKIIDNPTSLQDLQELNKTNNSDLTIIKDLVF